MKYVVNRLKEPSTWRGFFVLLAAFGVSVSPDLQDSLVAVGLAVAGLIGVLTPDK